MRTLNAEAVGSKTIETDTDVSQGGEWAVGDKILICDVKTDEVELFTIESFTGSTINLPAGGAGLAAAKGAGAFIVNATPNVEILTSITTSGTVVNLLMPRSIACSSVRCATRASRALAVAAMDAATSIPVGRATFSAA